MIQDLLKEQLCFHSYQNCGESRTPFPRFRRLWHAWKIASSTSRWFWPVSNARTQLKKKAQGARTTEFVAPTEPMLCSIASVVLPTKYIQKVYCNKKSAATEFDEDWDRPSTPMDMPCYGCFKSKIQQTKILVNGQRFGGLFYFGLM